MKMFKPKRIDIHEKGLAKFVGLLEAEILNHIWDIDGASARNVCNHLTAKKKISFNAVNTVLGRLVDKGILTRIKRDGCYQFIPRCTREELYKIISQDVFSSLLKDKKIFSVSSFAGALQELSTPEKKELLRVLQRHAKNS